MTIWLVETGDVERAQVIAAFTTRTLADEYAASRNGYVFDVELWDRPVATRPLYVRIAEVYPDGEVRRAQRVEGWDEPGPPPLSREMTFDGHLQGHCGRHIYVSGGNEAAVEAECERRIRLAVTASDGRCSCERVPA